MKLSTYIEKLQALLARAGDAELVTARVASRTTSQALSDTVEPELAVVVRLDQETDRVTGVSGLRAGTLWSPAEWETISEKHLAERGAVPAHTFVAAAVVGELDS